MGDLKASKGNWNICWVTENSIPVGYEITTQPHGSVRPIVRCTWTFSEGSQDSEELQANAHLLRSSRELYEALDKLIDFIDACDFRFATGVTVAQARAALSAARGETGEQS